MSCGNFWPPKETTPPTQPTLTDAEREAGPRLRGMNDGLLIGGGMRQTDAEYRAEIARLRLTDEEREAIEACVDWCDGVASPTQSERAATLRALLERTK